MSIIRVAKREHPYVILDKTCMEDASLSWRAKGLHAYLIGLPDNWQVKIAYLINRSTEGREAVRTAIKELSEAGYMKRKPLRDDNGRVQGSEWTVTERPETRRSVEPTVGQSPPSKEPEQVRKKETTSPPSEESSLDQSKHLALPPQPPAHVVAGKPSGKWVNRMCGIWKKHIGIIGHGQMGKQLKAAVNEYGEQAVAEALYAYCSKADATFASPSRFCTTINQWLPKQQAQSVDHSQYRAE